VLQIDAFVNGYDAIRRNAVGQQHLVDGVGRGDEAVHLTMFPP
jgi:hypothetical protein